MNARSIGLTLLVATVVAACGTSSRVAVVSPTASLASPTPLASVHAPSSSPQKSPPPSASPQQSASCAFRGSETFAPNAPSTRNLAIVSLTGSNALVVRDVTDINHATTVATLNIPSADPRFVGPQDVSWIWSDAVSNLYRTNIASGANTQVVACPALFDWTSDGTTAGYVWWDGNKSELRQIAHGAVTTLAQLPPFPAVGCESQGCADNWEFKLSYSPDGKYVGLIENFGSATFRIWSSTDQLVYDGGAHSSATAMVWSGGGLYFRDDGGVKVWRPGSGVTQVLPGIAWINPHASPTGGQILYTLRTASSLPQVFVLDTATGQTRQLANGADSPVFFTSRYVWYRGMRLCPSSGQCLLPVIVTGKTYIYDLQTGATFDSVITEVVDTWPHAG